MARRVPGDGSVALYRLVTGEQATLIGKPLERANRKSSPAFQPVVSRGVSP
ncbi:hypothetical protein SFUMM280S_09863 [Streptomyces fumanus]